MAVLTSGQISSVAVGLLTRELVLPATVTRVPGGEFAGSNGDTITVRVPQPGSANEQVNAGDTITYSDVNEVGVDVSLKHFYHAKRVSDEELSMSVENFGVQVTRVQASAVAESIEGLIAASMDGITADSTGVTDVESEILNARVALGNAHVPNANRYLAVSPDVANEILSLDKFSRADASGGTQGLRDATIGRAFGFQVVESTAIASGSAVAYHGSSFVFGNRLPLTPRGAASSSTATQANIGMRHVFQYDPGILSDVSVLSSFGGAALVSNDRVYRFTL